MFKFLVLSALVACAFGATIPGGMLPQLDGRIVGGTDTTIGSYPYIISLSRSGSHSCGGSLYSNKVVVTAAHCLSGVSASVLKVRAGSTYWSSGGTQVSVSKILIHPSYNSNTMVNDIGLVYLATAVTLGSNIQTIALVGTAPADGTSATVSGWGVKSYGSSTVSSTLQYVKVNIVSLSKCSSGTYSYGTQIKSTMICASASGKDACQGDSGGPLVVSAGQAGVVSWGYGCAQANYPGVYSDVAALKSWVVANA